MDKDEYIYWNAEILEDGTCHTGRTEIYMGAEFVDLMGRYKFEGVAIYFLCFELMIGIKTYL